MSKKKFEVRVAQISYTNGTLVIEAENEAEVEKILDDDDLWQDTITWWDCDEGELEVLRIEVAAKLDELLEPLLPDASA